ncbi:MAG TPA: thiamine pyrophosphate-dependent enzyme, partial [Roseiflexaceae bacterium]|nr:thiamine pyrophosphate-dependent enzyme [Roseiflexaceae bacterium]
MTTPTKTNGKPNTNHIGLTQQEYRAGETTLCQGCGHNSITGQIIAAAYELSLAPHQVIKMSGIGCSSKTPAYFLGRSHGFNTLHGRMPSVTTGAILANRHMLAIGVSGDGDTGSIGLGQFKHMVRRNVPMVYLIENN